MGVRLGIVSTYPPTQCGIATFTSALVKYLSRTGAHVGVVRIVDEPEEQVLPVAHQWVRGRPSSLADAAAVLDDYDAAVIQHEYGIFGGEDGDDVLALLEQLHVPVLTVLHTVLTHPTSGQWRVLAGVIERSAALITMTETARDRLLATWDVDPRSVHVIPHGAEDNRTLTTAAPRPNRQPTMLTWGLLSEGKGIEWALLALASLRGAVPLPHYRVLGRTHPRVLEREGEAYRERLLGLRRDLRLESHVTFDDRYLSAAQLTRAISEADVVLLPYESDEQVTSGVLTEAVAAGKPVISTSFPHAVELLSSGAGLLVPRRDPDALAKAITHIITDERAVAAMAREARRLAGGLTWPTVAISYVDLARSVITSRRLEMTAPRGSMGGATSLRAAV